MADNLFNKNDLVFVVDTDYGIQLTNLTEEEDGGLYIYNPIKFAIDPVTGNKTIGSALPYVVHATQDNEWRLKDIFGENLVPKIPLTGNQLANKLLRKQRYIVARVSNESQRDTAFGPVRLIATNQTGKGIKYDYIEESTEEKWKYVSPTDMNGIEIKESHIFKNDA